jgi:hypothetical protein
MIPMILPSGREILLPSSTPEEPNAGDAAKDLSEFEDVAFQLEFQDLVDAATEIGMMLRKAMETIRPRKAKVDLNVGVDAKTGRLTAFFVEGGASGSMKLTLEWGSTPESAELATESGSPPPEPA